MDRRTTGAWLVHHTRKLDVVRLPASDYEQVMLAGKCGILLNALAASEQMDIPMKRVDALAKANGLSARIELPTILLELERHRLIDSGKSGIAVLGLTTGQTLEHTADIFESAGPTPGERIALDIAEEASILPVARGDAAERAGDLYHVAASDVKEVLDQCEEIGFFDHETAEGKTLYFNGNLFRRDDMAKVNGVLCSIDTGDEKRIVQMTQNLKDRGCIPKKEAQLVLGEQLYSKLSAIGFIDENVVGNESGMFSFVTHPAAFCKFTNSAADDAFDLAKALVTSLTYGMTASTYSRGRITSIEALMRKLISGAQVGPATAIGQDYRILEMKGVVCLTAAGGGKFYMRLLKPEVGKLALSVILDGEAVGPPLSQIPGVSATRYDGPEINRSLVRRTQTLLARQGVARLLSDLRTGGLH